MLIEALLFIIHFWGRSSVIQLLSEGLLFIPNLMVHQHCPVNLPFKAREFMV